MKIRKLGNEKLRLFCIVISWLLVAACMLAIFFLSNQVAKESEMLSQGLLARIVGFFGNVIGHNTLRKFAHATEYFGLALLTFNSLTWSFSKSRPFATYLICLLYSITDEIHQYFIPGRACRIFDIFVDSLGAITAILIAMLITYLIVHKMNKKYDDRRRQAIAIYHKNEYQ